MSEVQASSNARCSCGAADPFPVVPYAAGNEESCQTGVSFFKYDGLSSDAFRAYFLIASSPYSFTRQFPARWCFNWSVRMHAGTISSNDICTAKQSLKEKQSAVIGILKEIDVHEMTPRMHALAEALMPLNYQAANVAENEEYKLDRFENLGKEIGEAKQVLCWHDGWKKRETETDSVIQDALKACISPDEVDDIARRIKAGESIYDKRESGPSFWKSLFTREGKARETIIMGMKELHAIGPEDAQILLLKMDLSNTRSSLEKRQLIEESILTRQANGMSENAFLRPISKCDIALLAFIKSIVPTFSITLDFGGVQVSNYLGSEDFAAQGKNILGSYGDDVMEARITLEATAAAAKAGNRERFMPSVEEARTLLRSIPKFSDPTDLDAAIAILNKIGVKTRNASEQAMQAARLLESYEKRLAADMESDMDIAFNAKVFTIDEFARRAGRAEFGKVLKAALLMNYGLDAQKPPDRIRRFARAQDVLRKIDCWKLDAPERRWLDEIGRLLGILTSGKVVCDDPLEEPTPYGGCDPTPASCAAKKMGFSDEDDIPRCVEKKRIIISTGTEDAGTTETTPAIECDITPIQMKKLSDTERDEWLKNCR